MLDTTGLPTYVRNRLASVQRRQSGEPHSASTGELCINSLSIDRSPPIPIKGSDPLFLFVKAGMTVIVQHLPAAALQAIDRGWG